MVGADIFVLYGLSGVGKSTLGNELKKIGFEELIGHTTRSPRNGEIDGVHYYFVSEEEFDCTEFIEKSSVPTKDKSYRYGISIKEVERKMNTERKVFCAINEEGYLNMKKIFGARVVGIFITVPEEVALERMIKRGDSKEAAEKRIQDMNKITKNEKIFESDFTIVNRNLQKAIDELITIVRLD